MRHLSTPLSACWAGQRVGYCRLFLTCATVPCPGRCTLCKAGCPYTGPFHSITSHEAGCDFVPSVCHNPGCEFTCLLRELAEHEDSCGYVRVRCPKCSSTMMRSEAARHDCTRDMLRSAASTMAGVVERFDALERRMEGALQNMAADVDRRLAAMSLKMERIHGMVTDRLSQSQEKNEILQTHAETMRIGRSYRINSHRGAYECPQPTPGVLAPPPEAYWTCCRQKEKASWCLIPPEED